MKRIQNNINTKEEKVANKIIALLSDLTLDIERIGYYASVNMPYIIYERFIEIAGATEYNRNQEKELNLKGNYYYDTH